MKDLLATVDDAGYLRAFTSLARRLLATAGDEARNAWVRPKCVLSTSSTP